MAEKSVQLAARWPQIALPRPLPMDSPSHGKTKKNKLFGRAVRLVVLLNQGNECLKSNKVSAAREALEYFTAGLEVHHHFRGQDSCVQLLKKVNKVPPLLWSLAFFIKDW